MRLIKKVTAAAVSLCIMLAVVVGVMPSLPCGTVAALGVSTATTTKVNIKCVYNGGNSEVYVNNATGSGAADGWNILYIYSSNILNSNAVFANLKGALNEPYSAMVPSVANENATVGLAVGTYGKPDNNWKSAEWVAQDIIPGTAASVTGGSVDAINSANIAAIGTSGQRFAAEMAAQEELHKQAWQDSEAEAAEAFEVFQDQQEADWNAAELAKQVANPNIILNRTHVKLIKALPTNRLLSTPPLLRVKKRWRQISLKPLSAVRWSDHFTH